MAEEDKAAWLAASGLPFQWLGLLGNSHATVSAHTQTRAGEPERSLVARPTGAPAPSRRDNSEIRLRADKRFGGRERKRHQKLVRGVPGTWGPLQPGVEEGDTLAAGRGPQSRGRASRSPGPRRVGGRGKERAEHEQKKQPNLGWELSMENGRGGGCSRARREAEGADRRARVRVLRGAAGE